MPDRVIEMAETPEQQSSFSQASPRESIRLLSSQGGGNDFSPESTMLAFFVSALESRIDLLGSQGQRDPLKERILQDVSNQLGSFWQRNTILNDEAAWNDAYKLERKLYLVEPQDSLKLAVERRLSEAEADHVPNIAPLKTIVGDIFREQEMASMKEHSQLLSKNDSTVTPDYERATRALLYYILEAHHKWLQQRLCMRKLEKGVLNRVVMAEILSFLFMIIPFAYIYLSSLINGATGFTNLQWLPLYLTISSGLFGAFFSRLLVLRDWSKLSLADVEDANNWQSILMRGAIGVSGALILYFFLQSNMLSGEMFPDFSQLGMVEIQSQLKVGNGPPDFHLINLSRSLALLLIWSFLAGFSERLVPTVLNATESSFAAAAAPNQSNSRAPDLSGKPPNQRLD